VPGAAFAYQPAVLEEICVLFREDVALLDKDVMLMALVVSRLRVIFDFKKMSDHTFVMNFVKPTDTPTL